MSMSTTSLKLTERLKERTAAAAKRQGKTPHAFMVEAIERAADIAEARAKFVAEAEAARKRMLKDGKGYAAADVHTYIRSRIAGKNARKPRPKTWQS
jgi:predicted DNA-binding protein